MENVVTFNNELSGLYDTKPPISKAKMAAITRAAMKAIKFYKHVVQSVEKFILKCKPEYKVPGLYVIDSIVRQSRHQFGSEKDVFAPRFARNMKQTFANLFRCAPEDKSRIIRVLNLWQKNSVFAPEVIQPLFDLADPNHPIYQQPPPTGVQDVSSISNGLNSSAQEAPPTSASEETHGLPADLPIGHQTGNTLDPNTIRHLQQLQQILIRQTNESTTGGGGNQSDSVKFNKKLLDYDYGDEEEEEKSASPNVSNLLDSNNLTQLLKDPNVLRQLQTLQKLKQQEEKQIKLNEMRIQEEAFDKHLQNVLKGNIGPPPAAPPAPPSIELPEKEVEFVAADDKIEVINLDGNDSRSTSPDRDRYKRRRTSRSRSRDRGRDRDRRRRTRSRSRSRSRSPKSNRRRTSRERDRNKEKEREKEKEKEREYERERRRKGLPDIKKEHLSVCSTTLWVGHLSKLVQQEELSDTFGKYGDIVSIDMIHPRGCAFIVMNRRQDAYKAMGSLKNHKMQGRAITISWAAGKGVKSKEWKDYWDLDLGVSYIPWSKLDKDTDMETLEEGGMFDEDSMPDWMKDRLNMKKDNKDMIGVAAMFGGDGMSNLDTTQPPPAAGAMIPGVPMVPQFPMGPVPRLIPPMGVPMPGNMVAGLPMPPNMVPGMPPPHMMIPPGSMVPGFAPMPPMDKSIPPPTTGPSETPAQIPSPFLGSLHMTGLAGQQPPNFASLGLAQFQQPPGGAPNSGSNQNDDHMDIEMEDENPTAINKPPQINFSQPPPMFSGFGEALQNQAGGNQGNNDNRRNDRDMLRGDDRRGGEVDFRDRSRDRDMHGDFNNRPERDRNRWGNDRGRSNDRDQREQNSRMGKDNMNENRDFNRAVGGMSQDQNRPELPQIWRDNGPNFQNQQNFNDNPRRGGMNIPAVDLQNPPPQHHRPHDFFDMRRDEFNHEERRSGGGINRDFFNNMGGGNMGNMGNRFGPPAGAGRGAPMPPMRGGPPPPFGPRLGPMFIRGPARPGPPAAPFAFNERGGAPFEREERGGRGNRGNLQDMRGGRGNWRDDEEAGGGGGDGAGAGGGGRRGNRFQNRDRGNRFNDREDRKGGAGGGRNDRDRERGDRDRDRDNRRRGDRDRDRGDRQQGRNRRSNSRHDADEEIQQQQQQQQQQQEEEIIQPIPQQLPQQHQQQQPQDTEEDWDQELSEHNIGDDFGNQSQDPKDVNTRENNEFSMEGFKGFESQQSSDMITNETNDDNACSFNEDEFKQKTEGTASMQDSGEDHFAMPAVLESHGERKQSSGGNFDSTPLYDEQAAGGEKAAFEASQESEPEAPPTVENVEELNN